MQDSEIKRTESTTFAKGRGDGMGNQGTDGGVRLYNARTAMLIYVSQCRTIDHGPTSQPINIDQNVLST